MWPLLQAWSELGWVEGEQPQGAIWSSFRNTLLSSEHRGLTTCPTLSLGLTGLLLPRRAEGRFPRQACPSWESTGTAVGLAAEQPGLLDGVMSGQVALGHCGSAHSPGHD